MEIEDADFYKCGSISSRTRYRVCAIDGTTVKLENSDELQKEYGQTTPCEGQTFARVSVVYDLNDFICDARYTGVQCRGTENGDESHRKNDFDR